LIINPLYYVRLADATFPQHLFAFSSAINFPLQLITTYILSHNLQSPLDMWHFGYKLQLLMCTIAMLVIFYYPPDLTLSYIMIIYLFSAVTTICTSIAFTSSNTFFARISDARIGGTYLTLLYTINNLGGTWPNFFVFYLVDILTFSKCSLVSTDQTYTCTSQATNECTINHGICLTIMDGFYIVGILTILCGLTFNYYAKHKYLPLQNQPSLAWKITKVDNVEKDYWKII